MANSERWYTCHSMMQESNENIREIIRDHFNFDYLDLIQICVTQQNYVVSPRHMSVIVAVAVVNIQTLGVSCKDILTS